MTKAKLRDELLAAAEAMEAAAIMTSQAVITIKRHGFVLGLRLMPRGLAFSQWVVVPHEEKVIYVTLDYPHTTRSRIKSLIRLAVFRGITKPRFVEILTKDKIYGAMHPLYVQAMALAGLKIEDLADKA